LAWLVAALLVAIGAALADRVDGPLPGDPSVTRSLQALFGDGPAWAEWITDSAKFPAAWITLAGAAALGLLCAGWRAAVSAPLAFGLALALDKLLRAVISSPRPSPDLVGVASPMTSSGLPSTFGLVYGALFGVVLLAAVRSPSPHAKTAIAVAVTALLAGCAARIVLGGHWPSQMVVSAGIGLLCAALSLVVVARLTGGR